MTVTIDAAAAWPEDGLERLDACPICTAPKSDRTVLHDGLEDRIFHAAPGRWTLWRCGDCGNGYLDPRPDAASIHLAYSRYYTHATSGGVPDMLRIPRTFGERLRALVRNDFLRDRLGHRFAGGHLPGARLFYRDRPQQGAALLHQLRHTPASARSGARLLDVGSGSGAFLTIATALGYSAEGLEPDPVAVGAGVAAGLSVTQGLVPGSGLAPGSYAHITLNHVFEHLHDPIGALAEIFALLEPGGRVWFAQPNLESAGLARFGPDWRGLEPPRHLTLWTAAGLRRALDEAGFTRFELLEPTPDAAFYFRQSTAIADGVDPYAASDPPSWGSDLMAAADAADRAAAKDFTLGETLYTQAFRPN